MESRRFLPIMLGEGGSYFGKDDLFFPLRNCLPDNTAAKRAFLFCLETTGSVHGRTHTCNAKSPLATSFGGVADWESKHLS